LPPIPLAVEPNAGAASLLEALLKRPAQLVTAAHLSQSTRMALTLGLAAAILLLLYGIVVGSFSGGIQLAAAPVKIAIGSFLSVLICLPSFFIFASLAGAEITLRGAITVLMASLALTAVLLLGFAPVAWVFSQSTDSVGLISTLHVIFWFISVGFGLRLLRIFMNVARVTDQFHIKVWTAIFIFVSLQMITALRPIVGTANTLLPQEKRFFFHHWVETLSEEPQVRR
jgi:hypothetical protein